MCFAVSWGGGRGPAQVVQVGQVGQVGQVAQVGQAGQVGQVGQAGQVGQDWIARSRFSPVPHVGFTTASLQDCACNLGTPNLGPCKLACNLAAPPRKNRPTKMSKMVCTILVRYRTSFPNTLYYYYCYYYYYYCYYYNN